MQTEAHCSRTVSLWRLAILAPGLLISACATTLPQPKGFSQEMADPASLPHWVMEGRIALRSGADGWQANVYWEHDGPQEKLRLSGPLNQGLVSMIIQSDLLYLNEGEGKVTIAHDPDSLLRERLGYTLPLKAMHYWILGRPVPEAPKSATVVSPEGQLQSLQQDGWVLAFEKYAPVAGGYQLPHKLSAEGHDVRLKWVLDEWHIPNTSPR